MQGQQGQGRAVVHRGHTPAKTTTDDRQRMRCSATGGQHESFPVRRERSRCSAHLIDGAAAAPAPTPAPAPALPPPPSPLPSPCAVYSMTDTVTSWAVADKRTPRAVRAASTSDDTALGHAVTRHTREVTRGWSASRAPTRASAPSGVSSPRGWHFLDCWQDALRAAAASWGVGGGAAAAAVATAAWRLAERVSAPG